MHKDSDARVAGRRGITFPRFDRRANATPGWTEEDRDRSAGTEKPRTSTCVSARARNESTRAVVKRACAPGKSYRTGRKRDEGICDLCARPSREQPPLSVEDAKADAEGYSLPLLAEGV